MQDIQWYCNELKLFGTLDISPTYCNLIQCLESSSWFFCLYSLKQCGTNSNFKASQWNFILLVYLYDKSLAENLSPGTWESSWYTSSGHSVSKKYNIHSNQPASATSQCNQGYSLLCRSLLSEPKSGMKRCKFYISSLQIRSFQQRVFHR